MEGKFVKRPPKSYEKEVCSKSVLWYKEYVRDRLEKFDEDQERYCRGKLARMKLDSHRRMAKANYLLAKSILEKVRKIDTRQANEK